ncbi:NifQ family protein [Magnetococcus marinus MC-1]|uniref:NifQ family protein n=1 Tax=Magnetococcus marinus (strain ATCC BAA-1437 / JCM 17883 / MC-1) TaxID=156889 RepID=A0L6X7_MAGMM|nr:nitrogen fixation protein NifQ [Magnetococcus marinus]ABK43720.1 NifQ family protein [Magnetococcus marinus MC-1]
MAYIAMQQTMEGTAPFGMGMSPLLSRLKLHHAGLPNGGYLLEMLSSASANSGAMPRYLGLNQADFEALMAAHFPGLEGHLCDALGWQTPVDRSRQDEIDELLELLGSHADHSLPGGQGDAMAHILAAGCLGHNHLWEDLGLWSRQRLSSLILTNFPRLSAKNDRNMKWKRFFYKQLCEQEGVYTCRAPSCAVCGDYALCFGPEM